MEKNWVYVEKGLAGFQILLGSVILYQISVGLLHILSYDSITWHSLSIPKIFINYHHQVILSLLTIFSGIGLIMQKSMGWIIALATVTVDIVNTCIAFAISKPLRDGQDPLFWLSGTFIIIFTGCFFLLLQKPIRTKYYTDAQTLIRIVALTLLLFIDKAIKYLVFE